MSEANKMKKSLRKRYFISQNDEMLKCIKLGVIDTQMSILLYLVYFALFGGLELQSKN